MVTSTIVFALEQVRGVMSEQSTVHENNGRSGRMATIVVLAVLLAGAFLHTRLGMFSVNNFSIAPVDTVNAQRINGCQLKVDSEVVQPDRNGIIDGWKWHGAYDLELRCPGYEPSTATLNVSWIGSAIIKCATECNAETFKAVDLTWMVRPTAVDGACDSCTPPSLPAPTGCPNCVPVTPVPTPTPFPPSVPTPTPVFAVPTLNEAAWLLIAGIEHARCPECSTAWPTETPPPSVECAEPVRLVGTPTIETPELQPELPDGAPEVTSEPTQYFGDVPIETPTMPASVSSCGA
jgi:hypothetical protein